MKKMYCIPSLTQLEEYLSFSEKYHACFEYNEFFVPALLDDEVAKERVIQKYLSVGRDCSQDTMHGAFLDICVNSADPRIFEASDMRIHQCMEIAKRMGLRAVIFHTNYIVNFRLKGYQEAWVARNEEYWRKILEEYPEQKIFMENMFDDTPELLQKLAASMVDEPRFAVCLDTAHALISGSPLEPWLKELQPYVAHIHINDNDGCEDLHQTVGSGIFCWEKYDQWVRSFEEEPSVLVEVRSLEDLRNSVRYMEERKIYPFG